MKLFSVMGFFLYAQSWECVTANIELENAVLSPDVGIQPSTTDNAFT